MIKNVALKKFLSGTVFRGITALNRAVPVRDDVILLYCNMEFRGNIRYLYDYLIEQGYNRKYTIIRSQNEPFTGPVPTPRPSDGSCGPDMFFIRSESSPLNRRPARR